MHCPPGQGPQVLHPTPRRTYWLRSATQLLKLPASLRFQNPGNCPHQKVMIFWLHSSFFFNIMFLNKVSGYSRAAAQGRSLGRASTWDLINQINNEASKGKQRTRYRPSCLFVFPLRHCSYKQWAHSKGFKNIPGEVSISTTQSPSPFSPPANTSLQKAILPVLETGNLWSVVPGMKKEDEYPDSNNLGMLLVAKGERKQKAQKDPICSQVRLSLA